MSARPRGRGLFVWPAGEALVQAFLEAGPERFFSSCDDARVWSVELERAAFWAAEIDARDPILPVAGDAESHVSAATVQELVALARAGRRDDFLFLAGAVGVADREGLWAGTQRRLGAPSS